MVMNLCNKNVCVCVVFIFFFLCNHAWSLRIKFSAYKSYCIWIIDTRIDLHIHAGETMYEVLFCVFFSLCVCVSFDVINRLIVNTTYRCRRMIRINFRLQFTQLKLSLFYTSLHAMHELLVERERKNKAGAFSQSHSLPLVMKHIGRLKSCRLLHLLRFYSIK